jgi:hypothetical protein
MICRRDEQSGETDAKRTKSDVISFKDVGLGRAQHDPTKAAQLGSELATQSTQRVSFQSLTGR